MFRAMVLLCGLLVCGGAAADDRLHAVRHWMYQLQGLGEDGAVAALARTGYDMLVLEPGQNFTEWPQDSPAMVRRLRRKPDGSRRLLLAYVDIGEAEDYRDYWQADWVAPARGRGGFPDFLVTADPDGWAEVIDVNLKGVYNGIRAALPVMKSRGGGSPNSARASSARRRIDISWVSSAA